MGSPPHPKLQLHACNAAPHPCLTSCEVNLGCVSPCRLRRPQPPPARVPAGFHVWGCSRCAAVAGMGMQLDRDCLLMCCWPQACYCSLSQPQCRGTAVGAPVPWRKLLCGLGTYQSNMMLGVQSCHTNSGVHMTFLHTCVCSVSLLRPLPFPGLVQGSSVCKGGCLDVHGGDCWECFDSDDHISEHNPLLNCSYALDLGNAR